MNQAYDEASNILAEYGIDMPSIDDNRRTWHTVYESLTKKRNELDTTEDTADRAKLHKALQAIERELKDLYHTKIGDMHPHLLFEEGEDSTYWLYDAEEGIYNTLNFSNARSLVMRALMNDGITPTIAWARECLAQFRAQYPERGRNYDEFDAQDNMLHVANGWLNLDTQELIEHTPDLLSLVKAATAYNPEATCPTYDKLFEEWEFTEDKVRAIDEFSGNTLTSDVTASRLLVLEGVPGTGKSLLSNIWTGVLGDLSVREYSLDAFTNNPRFCKSAFVGKRLVWFNETDPKRTQLGAELQKMVDGRTFMVERKGVNGYTEHKNMAKCILTTNGLPDNMGEGMESRILYVQFSKVYRGTEQEDPRLLDKIEKESSGILNRMLRGLKQYKEQGKYTKIESQDEIMEDYKSTSSLPVEFLTVHFDPIEDVTGETFIYIKDFIDAFRHYFKDKTGYFNSPEKIMKDIYRHAPKRYQTIFQHRRREGRGITGLTLQPGLRWSDDNNCIIQRRTYKHTNGTNSSTIDNNW